MLHTVLHLPTEIDPNETTPVKLRRHINFSRWLPQSWKSTSGFGFSDGTCLGMS